MLRYCHFALATCWFAIQCTCWMFIPEVMAGGRGRDDLRWFNRCAWCVLFFTIRAGRIGSCFIIRWFWSSSPSFLRTSRVFQFRAASIATPHTVLQSPYLFTPANVCNPLFRTTPSPTTTLSPPKATYATAVTVGPHSRAALPTTTQAAILVDRSILASRLLLKLLLPSIYSRSSVKCLFIFIVFWFDVTPTFVAFLSRSWIWLGPSLSFSWNT